MAVNERTFVRSPVAGDSDEVLDIPNLIDIQLDSYRWFCQHGLRQLFDNFSPIEDYTGNLSLEFLDYTIGEPAYSLAECRERDLTYDSPLKAKVRLVNKETGEIKESEVYMGELPCMTTKGTFLINGAERVVISQLARSPGVYFKDTIDFSGQILYSAQVIPNEGAWVEFDTDAHGVVSVKIGQTRKFPVTTLLRALDHFDEGADTDVPRTGTTEEMLTHFGRAVTLAKPSARELTGLWSTSPIADPKSRERMVGPFEQIEEEQAKQIAALKRLRLRLLEVPREMAATLGQDPTSTAEEGLLDIYRKMRPGDPPTVEGADSLVYSLFFDVKRYDVARVGRHKLNEKLGLDVSLDIHTLTRADVMAIVEYLIKLSEGEGSVDDIDHLQNKRIRAVGELLQNQLRVGFLRMERVARERMTSLEPEKLTAQSVISIKPITAAIKSFFGSGQLSQFMDQINPLAELAHKRRLSALGPGGLSKQSAKLEVRDVHHSHYGRICPIETPEGP
ncbi:MAG: DNA-directed RNA polymerase subunit beta, partial [Acidobacteriota bacterium]